jgi:CheY-like chemotaxis protein
MLRWSGRSKHALSGGRILVVDDEVGIRDTIGRFLESEGYDVAYSSNGVDALDQVAAQHPDVILLDLMMPGMNGREFIAALRDELKLTRIPVLVMTGMHGLPPHQAIALGASDVVEKPFDIDDILNKIALAMFRSQTEGDGSHGHAGDGTSGTWVVGQGEGEGAGESNRWRASSRPGSEHDSEHDAIPQSEYEPPPSGRHDSSGVVLVVEADLASRRRLDEVLAARGFRVLSMGRVTDELPRLARVLEPRAMMIDLGAPGASGLRTVRYLRQVPELDAVALLVVCEDPGLVEELQGHASTLAVEVRIKPVADEDLIDFLMAPPAHARRVPGGS